MIRLTTLKTVPNYNVGLVTVLLRKQKIPWYKNKSLLPMHLAMCVW